MPRDRNSLAVEPSPIERAIAAGKRAFGSEWKPHRASEAPGRLELLGNHVDYNGGEVIACAINRTISVAIEPTPTSGKIEIIFADSIDASRIIVYSNELANWRNSDRAPAPPDYLRGAIAALIAKSLIDLKVGARLSVAGDIPIGLGLSSSAALCVSLVMALAEYVPEPRDLVLLAQEAEHRAGTPCGTMDQSASVAGGFILFDASDVTFEILKPNFGEHVFAVADSGVSRSLGQSSYPKRVAESREALAIANRQLDQGYATLAELIEADLGFLSNLVPDNLPEALFHRIRHVVTECARVRSGYEALQSADWRRFGELMTLSGRSSATDYEISHPLVEELVARSLEVDGVLGARMMGGGEGGTALILAKKSTIPYLEESLVNRYYKQHGIEPGIHMFQSADGAAIRLSN